MVIDLTQKQIDTIDYCLDRTFDSISDDYEMTEQEKEQKVTEMLLLFYAIKDYIKI